MGSSRFVNFHGGSLLNAIDGANGLGVGGTGPLGGVDKVGKGLFGLGPMKLEKSRL